MLCENCNCVLFLSPALCSLFALFAIKKSRTNLRVHVPMVGQLHTSCLSAQSTPKAILPRASCSLSSASCGLRSTSAPNRWQRAVWVPFLTQLQPCTFSFPVTAAAMHVLIPCHGCSHARCHSLSRLQPCMFSSLVTAAMHVLMDSHGFGAFLRLSSCCCCWALISVNQLPAPLFPCSPFSSVLLVVHIC